MLKMVGTNKFSFWYSHEKSYYVVCKNQIQLYLLMSGLEPIKKPHTRKKRKVPTQRRMKNVPAKRKNVLTQRRNVPTQRRMFQPKGRMF